MNQVNLRGFLYATYFVCLYPGSVLAQRGVEPGPKLTCSSVVNTKLVSALSIDEISRLGSAVSIQNDFGGLTLQSFDEDDRPRRGKEIEIGFILARSGDLGRTPIGLIISSERDVNFNFRKSSESTISVESSNLKACGVLATFTLTEKGYVLRDRKIVAQVR